MQLEERSSLKKHNNIYYVWNYDQNIKKIIMEYKFKNKLYIGELLFNLINEKLKSIIKNENITDIIPIPINKKRRLERGFNQVEELLKFGKFDFIRSKRTKNSEHMYKFLNINDRKNNIKSAFQIDNLKNSGKILIIDDIITTGATINEFIAEMRKTDKNIKITVFTLALAKTARKINLKF